ncbi:Putative gustatory receptor 28a [Atta colombica]|uniref:Gustatory receptor n=1 Tax=Atta colombica TaxID=520822 RepID=A0A195AU97_9HYME|nr:Putative gustatory receptor 28a [Atta colombica]
MFNLLSKFQRFINKRKGTIWLLFYATNFKSLMYPCFMFSRILGIFPYKIDALNIKACKLYYILSTIITCAICICDTIIVFDININKKIKFKSISRLLERNCFYILSGSIIVITFILSEPRRHLLQTVLKLSLKLPQKSYQNLSRLIHAKDIFGFSFIIMLAIYNLKIQGSILGKITLVYIEMLVLQMDMLYINCVCVIKACFKQINDSLVNLRELMVNSEPYTLREINNEERNTVILMELKILKKQHMAISDTIQMLNMIFTLQLLFTIIKTFIFITFNLYFCLLRAQNTESLNNLEKEIYYNTLIANVTFYITKIMLIVWACETSKNQAMEISTTIIDVSNSNNDKEIEYELELFSLQLMHRKNIFSAKGFTINAKFLTTMIGGVVTYLLILIQFLLMSNSCNAKI